MTTPQDPALQNTRLQEARSAVEKARMALGNGDRRQARQWAERAAKLAPNLEDAWLILAAVAGPRQGLEYIRKALQVNPQSPRAQRGMEWVLQHLREAPQTAEQTQRTAAPKPEAMQPAPAAPSPTPRRGQRNRGAVFAIALLVVGCGILALAGWTAINSPVVASMLPQPLRETQPTPGPEWAQVSIPKPTYTLAPEVAEVLPTATPTEMPTPTASPQDSTASADPSTTLSTDLPTATESVVPAEVELPTAEPEWTGELSMEYVADTPTPEAPPYVPATAVVPAPEGTGYGEHWIDVELEPADAVRLCG